DIFSPTLGTITGRLGSGVGFAGAAVATTALAALWEVFKRILFALGLENMIPGGSGPASRPSGDQLRWAVQGWRDGSTLDLPYAQDMRWRLVIMDIPGTITVPPPPI